MRYDGPDLPCCGRKLEKTMENQTLNDRVGRCYELAGRLVSKTPGLELVHGALINPHGRGLPTIDHAWVRDDDRIYDPVLEGIWPEDVFMLHFQATIKARYTHAEVLENTLRTGHWGPW